MYLSLYIYMIYILESEEITIIIFASQVFCKCVCVKILISKTET